MMQPLASVIKVVMVLACRVLRLVAPAPKLSDIMVDRPLRVSVKQLSPKASAVLLLGSEIQDEGCLKRERGSHLAAQRPYTTCRHVCISPTHNSPTKGRKSQHL